MSRPVTFSGDLERDLAVLGLADWLPALRPLLDARLAGTAHGDMPRWERALAALPELTGCRADLTLPAITIAADPLPAGAEQALRAALLELSPWRKGPFAVGSVKIDSEWRSDLKWQRVAPALAPLAGRRVLDVGCGNGYYALRLHGAGAACVLGVDPTLLYVMQFRAIARYLDPLPVHVLPLAAEELPAASAAFDTVLSMGVLYHHRAPLEHLRGLRGQLKSGGELLLETLVLPGEEPYCRVPAGRYARMRNVWLLPSLPELSVWLSRCGYRNVRTVGVSRTGSDEQRSTDWMTFESLREALDPANPALTVEGWPAPRRAIVVAERP